jgi:hypothetical protein
MPPSDDVEYVAFRWLLIKCGDRLLRASGWLC